MTGPELRVVVLGGPPSSPERGGGRDTNEPTAPLRPAGRAPALMLTTRQRELLLLLAEGLPLPEAAARMGCSEATAQDHRKAALRRLGASSLLEAYRSLGWLRVPVPCPDGAPAD